MLNYIQSEVYRIRHNKKCFLLWGIVTVVFAVLLVIMKVSLGNNSEVSMNRNDAFHWLMGNSEGIVCLMIFTTAFMHDHEERFHTMKHSVAFGIARSKIFMARFVVHTICNVIFYGIINGICIGEILLLMEPAQIENAGMLWQTAIAGIIAIGAVTAVTDTFLINMESMSGAYGASIGIAQKGNSDNDKKD